MRALLLTVLLVAACGGSKKPATTPPPPPPSPTESEMKDERTPDDADDAGDEMRADPCDGGE